MYKNIVRSLLRSRLLSPSPSSRAFSSESAFSPGRGEELRGGQGDVHVVRRERHVLLARRGYASPPLQHSLAQRHARAPAPGGASRARPPRRARPAPTARSGVPRSPSSSGALALSFPICRRGGRRFFAGKSRRRRAFPRADGAEQVAASARRRDGAPRGDRRSSRAVVSPPFPTALGRCPGAAKQGRGGFRVFAAWGRDHQAGYAGDAGRHKHVRHGERAVFAAATFFLRSRVESGARELGSSELFASRRAPPVLVLTIVESRRREPGDSVPSVSSANVAALSQNRGVTTDGASARFRESAPRVRAARDAPAASREVSAKADSRAASPGASPPPRLPAREIENTSVGKGKVRTTTRSCPPRGGRFTAVRGGSGRRETKKNRAPPSESRDGTRREKAAASRGCRVSGNGGRSRRAPGTRGVGPKHGASGHGASGAPARAVSIAPRAGARARGRASRGAPLEPRAAAGRGQHVEKQQVGGYAPLCPGIGGGWSCSCSKATVWGALGSPSTCLRAGQFGCVHR